MKPVQRERKDKRYLLTLDLKPFGSQVKQKHSASKEFQSLAVRGKKLMTSRNSNRKSAYQNNEQICQENMEVQPGRSLQMNVYQSNTYRKNFSWLQFDDKLSVQERQHVKDQQSDIPTSAAHLTYPSSGQEHKLRHDNIIPSKIVWKI